MLWLGNLRSGFGQVLGQVWQGLVSITGQLSDWRKESVAENTEDVMVEALTYDIEAWPTAFWIESEALQKSPEELCEPVGFHRDQWSSHSSSCLSSSSSFSSSSFSSGLLRRSASGLSLSIQKDEEEEAEDDDNWLATEDSCPQCELDHWWQTKQGDTLQGGQIPKEDEVCKLKISAAKDDEDLKAELSDLRFHLKARETELKEIINDKEILRRKLQELCEQSEDTEKHLLLAVGQERQQKSEKESVIRQLNRDLRDAEKRAQDLEKQNMDITQEKEAVVKNLQHNLSEMLQVSEAFKKAASDFQLEKESAILACETILHQVEEAVALHHQNSQEKKCHLEALERKTAQLEAELCELRKKRAEEAKAYEETIAQLANTWNVTTSELQQKHDYVVNISEEKDFEIEELKKKIAKMDMDDRETKTLLSSTLEEKKHLTQLLTEKEAALSKLENLNMQLSARIERSSHHLPHPTVQNLSQNMQGRNMGTDAVNQKSQASPTALHTSVTGSQLGGVSHGQFEDLLRQLGKMQQEVENMGEWKRQILIRVHDTQFKSTQIEEGLRKSLQDKDVTIQLLHQNNQLLSEAIAKSSSTSRTERQQTGDEMRQRRETEHSLQNSVHKMEVMLSLKSDQLLALNGTLTEIMNENKVLREAETELQGRIANLEMSIYELRGENRNLPEQCEKNKAKCQESPKANLAASTAAASQTTNN